MITITPVMWARTLHVLRTCGAARECVVYWVAALATPDVVADVIHPEHSSTPWYYEVDASWLHPFFLNLHRDGRTVRAQVHTHAGEAFHSNTDDRWPLVNTPGFLSLVLPRFSREPLSVEEMYLAEVTPTGWRSRAPHEVIEGLS